MILKSVRRGIALTAIVAGLAFGMIGCQDPAPAKQPLYESSVNAPSVQNKVQTLEGRIVSVQKGEVSFIEGAAYSRVGAEHEFEYVIIGTADGKIHTLIYPYSLAIAEMDAAVSFNPVLGGVIDAETFIDNFIDKKFYTNDNVNIHAEGIIIPNGISYRGDD